MRYIVIEKFDPLYPVICTDETGYPIVFDNEEDAEIEAGDCQDGQVVELT